MIAAMRCAAPQGLNGLDYVEVSNDQLTLTAFFLGKLPPELAPSEPKASECGDGGCESTRVGSPSKEAWS